MFYVRGGIYTDTSFSELVPGTEENYGPFKTHQKALEEWKRRTFTQKLDICTHRMKIEEE